MLTDHELDHIASLARIRIDPHERERLKKDLSAILDYVAQLNTADTSSVEALYQTTDLINATRNDQPRHEFPVDTTGELLVKQAPAQQGRFVKVKSVLPKK